MLSLAVIMQEVDPVVQSTAEVRLELWGDYALADPLFLVLLPILAFTLWLGRPSRRHARARISIVAAGMPRSLPQRLSFLPDLLKALSIVSVVLALARPLRGNFVQSNTSEGVDIALLIDKSSSMEVRANNSAPTRFEIVKDVVGDFAVRRMNDREGVSDNVCLIAFAHYPELLCPFTLDSDALTGILKDLGTEQHTDLDATGIGVALAKASDVLRQSEAASRVIVLLTDGKNNVEEILPLEAAMMAAEEGIKVYTVFAGPRYIVRRDLMGTTRQIPVDTAELEEMARIGGGKFFSAERKEDLEQVYKDIEELERTEREEEIFAQHFDLYPWFLFPGLLMYLLAWLSGCTWARRLP
ncbi:MAG: Ca-activated chloride channel family protein [Planctomycetota bacterium]|jgi:Ca-activated chloride channel family protein